MRSVLASLTLCALSVWAQPPPESLAAFEVASIRLTPPGSLGYTSWSPYGTNRYAVSNATLDFLVQIAYGIPLYQISGVEQLGSEHYEISAKAEDGVLLTPTNYNRCFGGCWRNDLSRLLTGSRKNTTAMRWRLGEAIFQPSQHQ